MALFDDPVYTYIYLLRCLLRFIQNVAKISIYFRSRTDGVGKTDQVYLPCYVNNGLFKAPAGTILVHIFLPTKTIIERSGEKQ